MELQVSTQMNLTNILLSEQKKLQKYPHNME